jgi:SAM-dependent methyltransferase
MELGRPTLLLIFGAGASKDSISITRSELLDVSAQPPVTRDLLASRSNLQEHMFGRGAAKSLAASVVPKLDNPSGPSFEEILTQQYDQARDNPILKRAFTSLRFYLRDLFQACTERWPRQVGGVTNYEWLVREVETWRGSTDGYVLWVTFNYDGLLTSPRVRSPRMHRPDLPTAEQRAQARRLYGADPVGYEVGRPDYPERVFDVLATRCGLHSAACVLEIGPGTGRVTRRLTGMGAKVTAVEPDHALAAYLRELADTAVDVREETFEEVSVPDGGFDLVVAAMSFHWIDQDIGLRKLGRVVRPGGWVALWWTRFGDLSRPDPFGEATRDLIETARTSAEDAARVPFELDAVGWRCALGDGAGLVDIDVEVIRWTARLDLPQVRALYSSMIDVRRRAPRERERLLDELVSRAARDFGGTVERPFVTALYTGRRPDTVSN